MVNRKRTRAVVVILMVLVVIAAIFTSVLSGWFVAKEEPLELEVDTVKVETVYYPYNIPVEKYKIHKAIVQPGQNLAVLLDDFGLTVQDVHKLNEQSSEVFDTRKIRAGQPYSVYVTNDSLAVPEYFVYEENAKDYIVFDLRGDYDVRQGQKPVEWKQKEIKGVVKSSLWEAMQQADASPQLAMALAGIFGWSIDFFGIQKGDEFRVIYQQEFVEDKPLEKFHVLAASFCASDSLFYAIPFVQDGEELYYNEKGNSLEGAFLKAPLDFYRITSRFTNSRFHPVLKRYRAHHGVDYAAPTGTPVYAIANGKVIAKGYQASGGGNYVKIKHVGSYMTSYMHLSRFAKGLQVGSVVKQKQVIGYVGSTGLSTGPHLDFRVYENGKPINPLTVKSQPKKPVSEVNRAEFTMVCDSLMRCLQAL